MVFYVDTCIYVNFFLREDSRGRGWGKAAQTFFDQAKRDSQVIYVSSFVSKELGHVLGLGFSGTVKRFLQAEHFKRVEASNEDYVRARKLESEFGFSISFADCMHLVLSRRLGATLVTRDRLLLDAARTRCPAGRPEEV